MSYQCPSPQPCKDVTWWNLTLWWGCTLHQRPAHCLKFPREVLIDNTQYWLEHTLSQSHCKFPVSPWGTLSWWLGATTQFHMGLDLFTLPGKSAHIPEWRSAPRPGCTVGRPRSCSILENTPVLKVLVLGAFAFCLRTTASLFLDLSRWAFSDSSSWL